MHTDARAYQNGQYTLLYEVIGKHKDGTTFRTIENARSERDACRMVLSDLGSRMKTVVDIEATAV